MAGSVNLPCASEEQRWICIRWGVLRFGDGVTDIALLDRVCARALTVELRGAENVAGERATLWDGSKECDLKEGKDENECGKHSQSTCDVWKKNE
jgi:hypothetical protein